jgi:hypothetical protein
MDWLPLSFVVAMGLSACQRLDDGPDGAEPTSGVTSSDDASGTFAPTGPDDSTGDDGSSDGSTGDTDAVNPTVQACIDSIPETSPADLDIELAFVNTSDTAVYIDELRLLDDSGMSFSFHSLTCFTCGAIRQSPDIHCGTACGVPLPRTKIKVDPGGRYAIRWNGSATTLQTTACNAVCGGEYADFDRCTLSTPVPPGTYTLQASLFSEVTCLFTDETCDCDAEGDYCFVDEFANLEGGGFGRTVDFELSDTVVELGT